MIYENKIFTNTNAKKIDLSVNDFFKMHDLELIEWSVPQIDVNIEHTAKEILNHFSQCSDILLFLQSAITHNSNSYDIIYKLHPPYTTSELDCDYILNKLATINIINDFFLSSLSHSYRIIINARSKYDIKSLIKIVIYSLLKEQGVNDIFFNNHIKSGNRYFNADLTCICHKIILFEIAIASGLEKDVASHSDQLTKLSQKILNSYTRNPYISKFFIVTENCKKLLPSSYECVVSIDEISEFIKRIS